MHIYTQINIHTIFTEQASLLHQPITNNNESSIFKGPVSLCLTGKDQE